MRWRDGCRGQAYAGAGSAPQYDPAVERKSAGPVRFKWTKWGMYYKYAYIYILLLYRWLNWIVRCPNFKWHCLKLCSYAGIRARDCGRLDCHCLSLCFDIRNTQVLIIHVIQKLLLKCLLNDIIWHFTYIHGINSLRIIWSPVRALVSPVKSSLGRLLF